jgi:hypothetical protein
LTTWPAKGLQNPFPEQIVSGMEGVASSTMTLSPRTHRAISFGLSWDSDLPLSRFAPAAPDDLPADILIRRVAAPRSGRDVVIGIGGTALCSDGIRFESGREAIFDTIGGKLIEWSPDIAWTGAFPAPFYGTLSALLLAWRGCVPFHGTAVEIDGRAVLICGASGLGKSTLGAGMIALGAKLISDDLSVLTLSENGERLLYPGRPAMRLHSRIASYLLASYPSCVAEAVPRDKDFVYPPRVTALASTPLDTLIVLCSGDTKIGRPDPASLLHAQLFRPKWMINIPGYTARAENIALLARSLRVVFMPAIPLGDARTFLACAALALKKSGVRANQR